MATRSSRLAPTQPGAYELLVRPVLDHQTRLEPETLFEPLHQLDLTGHVAAEQLARLSSIVERFVTIAARCRSLLSLEELVEHRRADEQGRDGVTLSTVHGAKGGEAKVVFVVGVNEGRYPHAKARTVAEVDEERRVLYVALTRAIERLVITSVTMRDGRFCDPSRFLTEMRGAHGIGGHL